MAAPEGLIEERALPGLPHRARDAHKGDCGRVLVAAGSALMPGAAVLAARAAYRAGAGLVTVLTDPEVIPVVAAGITEAVFTDWSAAGELLATGSPLPHDAILVGPGLGTRGRGRLVFDLVRGAGAAGIPVILDADALNLVAAGAPGSQLPPDLEPVWTPHPGEFRRLTGTLPRGDDERVAAAAAFVRERGGVLVLKGHRTVVAGRGRFALNTTGNPGMATAGSGDVLAGTILALLGQGLGRFEAARLGVHLHGLAGDIAAARTGEIPLTAGDIAAALSDAITRHGGAADTNAAGEAGDGKG